MAFVPFFKPTFCSDAGVRVAKNAAFGVKRCVSEDTTRTLKY
jgi:hypothetical protein